MKVVVKIGTSSLTTEQGYVAVEAIDKLCSEVAKLRADGHQVVLVTSGAITAGLPELGFTAARPKDTLTLQAAAAVGQSRLLRHYDEAFSPFGLVAGQVLLSPSNFLDRRQYLHTTETFARLLALGVVPVVNENDVVADDEIRWGDNDRLAALVANLVAADLLVLLTDTAGLLTADPRLDASASLIEEVTELDKQMQLAAGGAGTSRGSGGMSSKLVAAHMASRSGVRAFIAAAARDDVLADAAAGKPGVGTFFHPSQVRMSARKLWIAYALSIAGRIEVDNGARQALVEGNKSLLAAGVTRVEGSFGGDEGVEIVDSHGSLIGKGITRYSAEAVEAAAGRHTAELPPGYPAEVIHRNDLVIVA